MVDNKYAVAYSEVLEILKHIPTEDYNKIQKVSGRAHIAWWSMVLCQLKRSTDCAACRNKEG